MWPREAGHCFLRSTGLAWASSGACHGLLASGLAAARGAGGPVKVEEGALTLLHNDLNIWAFKYFKE